MSWRGIQASRCFSHFGAALFAHLPFNVQLSFHRPKPPAQHCITPMPREAAARDLPSQLQRATPRSEFHQLPEFPCLGSLRSTDHCHRTPIREIQEDLNFKGSPALTELQQVVPWWERPSHSTVLTGFLPPLTGCQQATIAWPSKVEVLAPRNLCLGSLNFI